MIDLGSHPMYQARWLMEVPGGSPRLSNSYTESQVEDNAVALAEFANKGIGVIETGFRSHSSPFSWSLTAQKGTFPREGT